MLECLTSQHSNVYSSQPAADPEFPRGTTTPKGGGNLLFGKILPQTAWKWDLGCLTSHHGVLSIIYFSATITCKRGGTLDDLFLNFQSLYHIPQCCCWKLAYHNVILLKVIHTEKYSLFSRSHTLKDVLDSYGSSTCPYTPSYQYTRIMSGVYRILLLNPLQCKKWPLYQT